MSRLLRVVVTFKLWLTMSILTLIVTCGLLYSSINAQSSFNLPYALVPDAGFDYQHIVVKFIEGSDVRLRNNTLTSISGYDLSQVQTVLASPLVRTVDRLFTRSEADLAAARQSGLARGSTALADLNLYYHLGLNSGVTVDQSKRLITDLNNLSSVQIAYAMFRPAALPSVNEQRVETNYTSQQGYRNAAPLGVDINYAWEFAGGRGDGLKFIDLEYDWNFDHEDYDLDTDDLIYGVEYTVYGDDHGTAVLGQVVGAENSYGVTGLVPNANLKLAAPFSSVGSFYNVAAAVDAAAGTAVPGDVILLEQQTFGPNVPDMCTCGSCTYYVPIEYDQATFDAIQTASANGIIIVEAGANGGVDLDNAVYAGKFNRSVRDSGAIIVGAGYPDTHEPFCWSNSGSRVDLQGWGSSIVTTGYGDLYNANANEKYTSYFGGTSGASPIVSGVVLSLQGIIKSRGDAPLTSAQMIALLRTTGTAQGASARQIGPLPDLRAAITEYLIASNLVDNGSFEDSTTAWVLKKTGGEKVQCGLTYGYEGECAFRFKGSARENSKLSQNIDLTGVSLVNGNVLNLSFYAKASASSKKVKASLIVTYADTTFDKVIVTTAPSDGYIIKSGSLPLTQDVTAVKVQFKHRGTAGKVYIDDVSLTVENVIRVVPDGLVPLPAAP